VPRTSSVELLKPPAALPNPLFHHCVRGYLDGDGSAFLGSGSPTITLCGNLEFLVSLQGRIVVQAKIDSRLYPHSSSTTAWYLVFRGWERCQQLGDWLYRDATPCLERKRAHIESFKRSAVGSAGQVSAETIKRYIASQGVKKERSWAPMRKAFKYRLYPTAEQERALAEMLDTHRHLYNRALAERKTAWEEERRTVTYGEQSAHLKPSAPAWQSISLTLPSRYMLAALRVERLLMLRRLETARCSQTRSPRLRTGCQRVLPPRGP
jgi:Helix-turn-helix domain